MEKSYIGVHKRNFIYLSLPGSYIYLSYHRSHISSMCLTTTNATLHGKTSLHIKFIVLSNRVHTCHQKNFLCKRCIQLNHLISNLSLLHLIAVCFEVTSLTSEYLVF